jgi:hypothetical protein
MHRGRYFIYFGVTSAVEVAFAPVKVLTDGSFLEERFAIIEVRDGGVPPVGAAVVWMDVRRRCFAPGSRLDRCYGSDDAGSRDDGASAARASI